jgi:eukaryotic-like serine/threonine-protein kinase
MSLEGYLLGHYRLQRLIGSGSIGDIYLAQDTHVPRPVAVKVLRTEKDVSSDSSTSREAERLLEREMKTISLLDHPHILPIFDYGTEQIDTDARTYLVMPYRPEGSLRNWLLQQESTILLNPYKIIHILLQAADALQHAHERQILHQDIKPANFLIRMRNSVTEIPDVLLADFGLAKFIDVASSVSQNVRGTPIYMPPEQWEGQPVPASDQYALAVMAFLMLTGHTPFRGTPGQVMHQHIHASPPVPSTINPHLPTAVNIVLLRALAKQPQERFPSVLQFAQALQQAFQQREILPTPLTAPFSSTSNQLPQAERYVSITTAGQAIAPLSSPGAPQQEIITSTFSHLQPDRPPLSSSFSSASLTSSSSLSTQKIPLSAPVVPPPGAQVPVQPVQQIPSLSAFARSQKLLLIGLVAFIVLGSNLAIFYVAGGSINFNSRAAITGTATQNNDQPTQNATAMLQTHMTGTAQAFKNITATAVANDPYLNGKGTLLANDPLNTPDYWKTQTSGSWGGTCLFQNDSYQLAETVAGRTFGCNAALLQGKNFIYEVQITILSGDCGGFRFRYNTTKYAGYTFRLCHDGFITLTGGGTTLFGEVSPAVHQGYNQRNTIAVLASGYQIHLYVNKQPIITITDNRFSQGAFALDVQDKTQPTAIAFNNAKIWQL